MPATFTQAPEVKRIAEELIPEHFTHLIENGVRLEYLFRDDKPFKNGKAVLGTCRKIGGLNAFLANGLPSESVAEEIASQADPVMEDCPICKGKGKNRDGECIQCDGKGKVPQDEDEESAGGAPPFFVITMSSYWWDEMDEHNREALTFHELSHAGSSKDDKGGVKLTLLPHDLEEFRSVVEKYGLWMADTKKMARVMAQHQLELEISTEPEMPDITIGSGDQQIHIPGKTLSQLKNQASGEAA